MADTSILVAEPKLARLDWECDHFGWLVAQLGGADLSDDALADALRLAREQGVQLLVWPAPGGRMVPPGLLDEFAGALVDRKATFSRALRPVLASDNVPPGCQLPVVPYTATTASAALIELALSAGAYSRFHVDPHVPHEKFEAMYCRWIERSVSKELADVVLVVPLNRHDTAPHERLGGMITLSESGGVASIGLVAVNAAVRGMGIGTGLMRAAHCWMRDRGAHEARVVTQLANPAACRLYERSGYGLSRVQHYYHFRPSARSQES